ncbi:MAG: phosphohistidine phosphatase SixA [Chloroflexi bacterium AL-W]|nr:phosphohistidine phosphatase SixA [Chloroflexi bacterium AL-N1]NOK71549.1 phosphohistidine phosphatase SixA [Chloroflexi bacterium AL-N10]NOK78895.1 phosphohistidine phosphatase SixA [Chloroflexi bacterium AL-N5]NOK86371.1 phosphohistidine phosphatase SixA [Chloroflexi bacterium AL-W]NOK93340.1 phosphohistidine phosphatase SixA [Chloroflexi bacterium AL-N15]
MELYLLRHGIAADVGPDGSGDVGRPLTDDGITKMYMEAHALKKLAIQLDIILTSPLVRAQQTAEIVGETLGITVQQAQELALGCDVAQLRTLLQQYPGAERVLIVGHEPDFSNLIGTLTGGSNVVMKKGGLGKVDLYAVEAHMGTLSWLLPPRVLRTIGK